MKIENDIKKTLIRNSLVTWGCVLIVIATLYFHFSTISQAVSDVKKNVYMINPKGEVIPTELMNRRGNLEIEIKGHLSQFADNYYCLNQLSWEKKVIERALYLGDFETQHIDRKNKGYYNKFIQYNIQQEAFLQDNEIELRKIQNTENYIFNIIIYVTEKENENVLRKYIILANGKAKMIDRNYPKNTHGIWIYDYVEEKILKDETTDRGRQSEE